VTQLAAEAVKARLRFGRQNVREIGDVICGLGKVFDTLGKARQRGKRECQAQEEPDDRRTGTAYLHLICIVRSR